MHDQIPSFEELDRDGAIEEAAGRAGVTRSQFLRRSAFAGGGLLIGGLPAAFAVAKGSASGDIDILNYALTLEYLEAAFYKEAVDKAALAGQYARFAKVVAAHEAAHVDALKKALGSKAVAKPKFDFKGTTGSDSTFGATSKVLEDTGVKAYQGQVTNIKGSAVLTAAGSILPIEARHAAWIASILSKGSGSPSPAPDAFNPSADMATVLAAVKGTGFITTESGASSASPTSGTPSVAG